MSEFHGIKKVLLHDHLDGGLRHQTVLGISKEDNVPLPDGLKTVDEIAAWFRVSPGMSMEEVFKRFDLPIALMKSKNGIIRVMEDAVEDYLDDNVIYVEPRFAPQQHTGSLTLDEVIEAAVYAFKRSGVDGGLILCAMRQKRETTALIDAAIRWKEEGVIGVDLAGPEPGQPLAPHARDFDRAKAAGLGVTLHAGEMAGPKAIAEILDAGFSTRVGHGVQIIRDCAVQDDQITDIGPIARRLHDAQTLLEICVSSNKALGIEPENHPVRMLRDAGFRISINTDNRIGRARALTGEYELLSRLHGFRESDFTAMNEDALASAFSPDAKTAVKPVLSNN